MIAWSPCSLTRRKPDLLTQFSTFLTEADVWKWYFGIVIACFFLSASSFSSRLRSLSSSRFSLILSIGLIPVLSTISSTFRYKLCWKILKFVDSFYRTARYKFSWTGLDLPKLIACTSLKKYSSMPLTMSLGSSAGLKLTWICFAGGLPNTYLFVMSPDSASCNSTFTFLSEAFLRSFVYWSSMPSNFDA